MTNLNQKDRSDLMEVLWSIQSKKGCIQHDDITKIAQEYDMSRMELEGIVTFYHFYHRTPSGRYTIYLNDSIVAEHQGRPEVLQAFEDALGIKLGSITADGKFGLFKTACIGLSDQEPSCLINFRPFTNLTPAKVHTLIKQLKEGQRIKEICSVPETNIRYTPAPGRVVFFKPFEKFSSLKHLTTHTSKELLEVVKSSKLTGRGGAFFPTGLKWQFCRNNKAKPRYLLCNADEGEPGTFKDRVLLQDYPETLIEGMILGAYAIGASQGAIYLRAEYMYLKKPLEDLLQEYRDHGFLGRKIKAVEDFSFDMYIHMGAGAYVCGEGTALIHSMEGKRGEPGTREHHATDIGFNNKPTVVNNVETLCAVPRILEMGLEHYLQLGTEHTPGTKLLSVSGDCKNPGLYEIEWGMKLKELLKLVGQENPYFVIFNGYAGETLSKADLERDISGENLMADEAHFNFKNPKEYAKNIKNVGLRAGGSVMIFDHSRNLLEVLKNVADFFVAESCGICVPCRTGNFLLNKKIEKILQGHGEKKDLQDIIEWSQIIKVTSRCGLGKMSSTALNSAILKFPEVFDKHLLENTDLNKAFDLETNTMEYNALIEEMQPDDE